jgi:hypothetical protein
MSKPVTLFNMTIVINFTYMYKSFILAVFTLQAFGIWVRRWTQKFQV